MIVEDPEGSNPPATGTHGSSNYGSQQGDCFKGEKSSWAAQEELMVGKLVGSNRACIRVQKATSWVQTEGVKRRQQGPEKGNQIWPRIRAV